MRFDFISSPLNDKGNKPGNLFGALPAIAGLAFIFGLVLLSFFDPFLASMLVIAFCLYFLLRFIYSTLFILLLQKRLLLEKTTDWMSRVEGFDNIHEYWRDLNWSETQLTPQEKASLSLHRKELEVLKASKQMPASSSNIYHLLIIPFTDTFAEKFEERILSILSSKFPLERILIVVVLEGQVDIHVQDAVIELQKKYKNNFFDFFIIDSSGNLQGSQFAGGSVPVNAMQKIKEIFKDKDVYPEDVIVSALRLNVKLSHHHLSCLTYYYMVHPLRNQASFQFFPTYTDDIWGKSGIARVFNISSSFFQLIDSSNPQRLIPFSDFSISFKTLIDIGRTPFDLLIDPPAIFWEAFVYFDGSYELSPIYIKLPWDIIAERSLKNTMHKIYAQKQGHAAGIYKLPNLIKAFLKDSYIPTWKKIKYTLKLLEFYFFDTLWPVFFGFLAWLPALFVWPQFANMRLYYSSSRITLMISSLVFMNIFILIILCLMFLPKRKIKLSLSKVIGYVLQWFLIPFFGIFLTTIPALLVQIRLMKKSFAFKTAEPDKK